MVVVNYKLHQIFMVDSDYRAGSSFCGQQPQYTKLYNLSAHVNIVILKQIEYGIGPFPTGKWLKY